VCVCVCRVCVCVCVLCVCVCVCVCGTKYYTATITDHKLTRRRHSTENPETRFQGTKPQANEKIGSSLSLLM
jgi:hypothetical protein